MPLRCRVCKAWRIGDRIILRTHRTDTCPRCEPAHRPALDETGLPWLSETERAPVRQWLLGAPLFTEQLLTEARAAYRPGPAVSHISWDRESLEPTRVPVPWADTLDLDTAANWLCWSTNGSYGHWPLITDIASRQLWGTLVSPWDLDIGATFGQRGFPHPPDRSELSGPRGNLHTRAGLRTALAAVPPGSNPFGRPRDLTALPAHYTDVLTIELRALGPRDQPLPGWPANGSIFREEPDRVVVLWR